MLILIIILLCLCSKSNSLNNNRWTSFASRKCFDLKGAKFESDKIISISAMKPLGLSLAENEENGSLGVYIEDIKEGSVKQTGLVKKGLYLLKINDEDVRYSTFDNIMDLLVDFPVERPLTLSFIDPKFVMKGPALVSVITPEKRRIEINALKGQNLRTILLSSGVEVYDAKGKFSNCGGGGNCGTCVVRVSANDFWEQRPKFESLRLKKHSEDARLSCNTIIEGDCTVTIRPEKIN